MNFRIVMQHADGRRSPYYSTETHQVAALQHRVACNLTGRRDYRYPIMEYRSDRLLEMQACKIQAGDHP